jgi:hypothetical protein
MESVTSTSPVPSVITRTVRGAASEMRPLSSTEATRITTSRYGLSVSGAPPGPMGASIPKRNAAASMPVTRTWPSSLSTTAGSQKCPG